MRDAPGKFGVFYERHGIIVQISEYLIGVTTAALICAIVKTLLPGKGTLPTVVKLISGVLMLLVLIKPLTDTSAYMFWDWTDDISFDGQSIVTDAQAASKEVMRTRIKEQTQAYILSKAKSLGAQVEVSVTLSEEALAVPIEVCIEGNVSPYAKQVMMQMITNDLGIKREAQQWIG